MNKRVLMTGLVALTALSACNDMHDGKGYHGHKDGANSGWWEEHKESMLKTKTDEFFTKADTNHDGYISWHEMESYARAHFRDADTNHDGKLSRDEVVAMEKKHIVELRNAEHEDKDNRQ